MQTIHLNGANFNDMDSFYDEVQRVLCPTFSDFGRNLDAFDDVLHGGFGVIEPNEPVELHWLQAGKSKVDLSNEYQKIVDVIGAHNKITFVAHEN